MLVVVLHSLTLLAEWKLRVIFIFFHFSYIYEGTCTSFILCLSLKDFNNKKHVLSLAEITK